VEFRVAGWLGPSSIRAILASSSKWAMPERVARFGGGLRPCHTLIPRGRWVKNGERRGA
jgi:hypothetical protein